MKKIVTIIIVIAVIVGAFFFFRSGDKKVTTYETVELKKGSINNTVTATGTIEPITKVDVGTQVSGTISHIYVDYNSVVTKGRRSRPDIAARGAVCSGCRSGCPDLACCRL